MHSEGKQRQNNMYDHNACRCNPGNETTGFYQLQYAVGLYCLQSFSVTKQRVLEKLTSEVTTTPIVPWTRPFTQASPPLLINTETKGAIIVMTRTRSWLAKMRPISTVRGSRQAFRHLLIVRPMVYNVAKKMKTSNPINSAGTGGTWRSGISHVSARARTDVSRMRPMWYVGRVADAFKAFVDA
jgi:hypothetical protein